jgi:DNA-binding transcriptional LysR family regulator
MDGAALEMASGWEAELHVVVDGALPMRLVTSCVRSFAQRDVPTRLRLEVAYQEGVLDSLNRWSADFAMVLGLDASAEVSGYDVTALGELPFVLVAAPEHLLTGGRASKDDLEASTELVVRDSSSRYAKNPKQAFSGSRSVVYLSDFHAKRAALLDGVGHGWLPKHLVVDDLASGRLCLANVDLNTWSYSPALVRPSGRATGRGAALFLETLQDALPLA